MGHSKNASIYSLYRNEQNKLQLCQVSVSITSGLNDCKIIGSVDKTIKEASLRIKSAFKASELKFPTGKIVVNINPVLDTKSGTSFDLPIALALLAASKQFVLPAVCLAYGELTLAGQIIEPESLLWQLNLSAVKQQLVDLLAYLKKLCPTQRIAVIGPYHEKSASNVDTLINMLSTTANTFRIFRLKDIAASHDLAFQWEFKKETETILPVPTAIMISAESNFEREQKKRLLDNLSNMADLSLQTYSALSNLDLCKSALKLALAGGHSLALIGSNGSGKTELLHSATYFLQDELKRLIEESKPMPNDLSDLVLDVDFMTLPSKMLNYRLQKGCFWNLTNGLIFLSELNKFKKGAILCLEQFFQQQIALSNKQRKQKLIDTNKDTIIPHCQLLADFNPCSCGNLFEPWLAACRCSDYRIKLFNQRLTGAIWDRLAIIAIARRISDQELYLTDASDTNGEKNKTDIMQSAVNIKRQIIACRKWQRERNAKLCQHACLNSQLNLPELDRVKVLNLDEKNFLHVLRLQRHFSYRRIMYIRSVALTLADLAHENCQIEHFLQASNYCALPEEIVNA